MQLVAFSNARHFACRQAAKKLLLFMKLTVVLLLSAALQVSANNYAQKVTLSYKNAPVKKVFREIIRQTGISIIYNEQTFRKLPPITIQVKDVPLEDVLRMCISDQGFRYEIVNNSVVISKRSVVASNSPPDTDIAIPPPIVIKGRVMDANGNALEGASVRISGSLAGTSTDAAGYFSLTAPDGNAILEISFVGFETQSVKVADVKSGDIAVSLKETDAKLSEFVVVGYGRQKRASVTGAVTAVNAKEIDAIPTTSLSNLLAGRLPGAQIVNNSGFVGASSDILVRGVGSGNGGTYPLVVIDNVVATRADFDVLDPNEVASVTLLKDAATAAMYGARASNGVLLVTTRSGGQGKPAFTFKSYYTTSSTTRPLQTFTATDEITHRNNQYKHLLELAGQPVNTLPYNQAAFDYYKDKSYNLLDNLWRSPSSQQNDLSVSGGTEQLSYFMLGGFNKSTGSFNNTAYDRYNFRSKVEAKISDNLKVGVNLSGYRRTGDRFYWPYDGEESVTLQDFYRATFNWSRLNPFYAKADGTPTSRTDPDGFPVISGGWHPLELVYYGGYRKVVYNNFNGIINIDLKIPFIKGLSTSVLGNYNADTRNAKAYIKHNKAYFIQFQPAGPGLSNYVPAPINFTQQNIHNLSSGLERVTEAANFDNSYQFNWFVNYARVFGKHDVQANLIYEQAETKSKNFNGSAGRLVSSNIDQILAASTDAVDRSFAGGEGATARLGWIGRLHYEYNQKYIAEFAFRRDASYIFAPGKRAGFFPSISAAWRITRESFFDVTGIDDLKLRASMGTTGNDNISPYQWQNNYSIGNSYGFGNTYLVGLSPNVLPNPFVTWEKSKSLNIGLDFSILNNKIFGEFDYFRRNITDILGTRIQTLPGTLGATLPAVNYAEKSIRGYEFSIGYRNAIGDLSYAVGANMGYAKDEWDVFDEPEVVKGTWRSAIGQPSNRLYGFISKGIIRDQKTIDALMASGFKQFGRDPILGALLFEDIRGANFSEGPDGKIDDNDATYLSSNAVPRINFGITASATWKNFKLDVLFQGVGAYDKIISTMNTSTGGVFQVDRPYFALWTDAWSSENPDGKYPKILDWGYQEAGYAPSSFWMRSGSYIRLRNLNVAYSIPRHLLSKIGLKQLQVFFTGTNLLTLSEFKEYDPEQPALDSYPVMKSYSGGISINF